MTRRTWQHTRVFALILLIALVVLPASPAAAQGTVTLNIDRIESGSGDAMTAYVSVRDENGVPVSGLTAQNFTIVEDNATSFPPDAVRLDVNPNARLSVALIIDLSGTMRDQAMADAKAASQQLLETLLNEANDADRAAFFGINGPVNIEDLTIHEDQPEIGFTNDRNKILNLVNTLEGKANVATPLYDALFRVAKITSLQAGPRAIIVVTDGQDPKVSGLAADDPITVANRNNIPIYPIGFSRGRINDAYLTRLAANTGGRYQKAAQANEIAGLFQAILSELSEQYVLSYNTRLERNDQPHAVITRVESAKGKAFDDEIFLFKDVPVAAPTVASVAAEPGAAEPVAPAAQEAEVPAVTVAPATPEPFPQNVVSSVKSFVENRDNLPWLIGIVVALIALLALLIFLLARRRRGDQQVGADSMIEGQVYPPINTEGPTLENPVSSDFGPTVIDGQGDLQSDPWRMPPTEYDRGAGGRSYEPAPFSYQQNQGTPAASHTVILDRKPKQQVVAILVNRKNPQERFDVVANTNIGRASESEVVIQDGTVSRKHAKIKLDKGEFRIFDLASANHTYVNSVQVLEPAPLNDGDVIKFGEVEFLFKRLA